MGMRIKQGKTIWKFPIQIAPIFTIEMPEGAQIVHVEQQGEGACIWAAVLPDAIGVVSRTFLIAGTGTIIPVDCEYVGTFQQGAYVWHILEQAT